MHYYDTVKNGFSDPVFLFIPAFDTTLLHLFKKRQEIHDNLTKFLKNLDGIIDEKRKLVQNKVINETKDEERDLLTLMIESEMNEDEGNKMSNEELSVSYKEYINTCTSTHAYVGFSYIEQFVCILFGW